MGIVPGAGLQVKHETFKPSYDISPVSGYSPALSAGDFRFVPGQTGEARNTGEGPLDPEVRNPRSLWRQWPIKLETDFILNRKLKASLAGAGASLDGVVKAQVYLSDREDVPGFNEVWLSYFKNPPATTIIATAQPGFGINNLRIEINTITLADNAKTKREAIRGPEAPAFDGYVSAVKAGELLFLSGLMAVEGGRLIDEHFRSAPLDRNLPVLMGLLGVWNQNFLGVDSHAVLPYDQRLHRFPAYLQQLEMESNGKRVTLDGNEVDYRTGAVVWGEPGNNAQHSFFQLLHQGTAHVALDFIAPVNASSDFQGQQNLALANCFAQAQAFAFGQTAEQVHADLKKKALSDNDIAALLPHKIHPGNCVSTIVLFPRLGPRTLGKLIALYEHKVFVQSVIWGINAFDQWGVELGKKLAEAVIPAVEEPDTAVVVDPSLVPLLAQVKKWRT